MIQDTTYEMHRLQLAIIRSKTPEERALMGVDMIDSTYTIVKNSILRTNPGLNQADLTALIFKRYYKNDFPEQVLKEIMQKIKEFRG